MSNTSYTWWNLLDFLSSLRHSALVSSTYIEGPKSGKSMDYRLQCPVSVVPNTMSLLAAYFGKLLNGLVCINSVLPSVREVVSEAKLIRFQRFRRENLHCELGKAASFRSSHGCEEDLHGPALTVIGPSSRWACSGYIAKIAANHIRLLFILYFFYNLLSKVNHHEILSPNRCPYPPHPLDPSPRNPNTSTIPSQPELNHTAPL